MGFSSSCLGLTGSYGVFGHFDLAALHGCHTFNVCLLGRLCTVAFASSTWLGLLLTAAMVSITSVAVYASDVLSLSS
jgi:hypothetical protein